MTDRLRELLDPKRLQNGPEAWQRESPACAEMRVRIVRETMLECAKVMCEDCEFGRCGTDYDCKAYPIHALLAEESKP